MKILMLTDRMDRGGAETHIIQLMSGLRERGAEVLLISSGGTLAEKAAQMGFRQYHAPLRSHNPFVWLYIRYRLRRLIRKEKVQILHAHARIPALLIRGLGGRGVAKVVTVHARFRSDPLLSRICNWGDHTVAVSEDLRTYVCDTYGVCAERVHVIPNGIDCRRFIPIERSRNTQNVVFASRLDTDCSRGAELLCSIAPSLFRDHPQLRISIAGGGSELTRIRSLAEQVNRDLNEKVINVLGWSTDMPKLLQNGDIFVGVSRAAMEAGACGCAVILCGNEGYGGILTAQNIHEEIISNFCGRGAVLPTAELLERDLRVLLRSNTLCAQHGNICRDIIERHLSAERMCDETFALYRMAIPQKPQLRITIGGYFGCGNTGDDAILLGFLTAIREIAPRIEITALTATPRRSQYRFGVRCVNRKNPIGVRLTVARSDALLCGGGSLLQNLTSNRSLLYYLSLLRLSVRMRKTTVLFASGIGPLIGKAARRRVTRTLAKCQYISLRDEDSFRLLGSMGVDAGKLRRTADLALLMPPPSEERGLAILRANELSPQKDYLCVILRGGASCALIRDQMLAAVRMICRRHNLYPLFPVFDTKHDASETRLAATRLGGSVLFLREPSDAAAILSMSQVVVTMRLHALVLASAAAVPAVGVPADGRDKKILSFAKAAGQDSLLTREVTVAALVERIESALIDPSRRAVIVEAVELMRESARADLQRIAEMIENTRKDSQKL